jgi:hypothetical protein
VFARDFDGWSCLDVIWRAHAALAYAFRGSFLTSYGETALRARSSREFPLDSGVTSDVDGKLLNTLCIRMRCVVQRLSVEAGAHILLFIAQ